MQNDSLEKLWKTAAPHFFLALDKMLWLGMTESRSYPRNQSQSIRSGTVSISSRSERTLYNVEHCILHGEIIERQKEQKAAEWKYLVNGVTFQERGICVVAKTSVTGKMVIITVYAA